MGKQTIEVLVQGGHATPAPPLGPTLSQLKVNIPKVIEAINEKTKAFDGMEVPVKVIVDDSKAFTIQVGTPPTTSMLKKEMNLKRLATINEDKSMNKPGDISFDKIVKITKAKEDALSGDMKSMVKQILGTCQSGGVTVDGKPAKQVIKEVEQGLYDQKLK